MLLIVGEGNLPICLIFNLKVIVLGIVLVPGGLKPLLLLGDKDKKNP